MSADDERTHHLPFPAARPTREVGSRFVHLVRAERARVTLCGQILDGTLLWLRESKTPITWCQSCAARSRDVRVEWKFP